MQEMSLFNINGIMGWILQSALHICCLSLTIDSSVDNYRWVSHVSEYFNVQGRAFYMQNESLRVV